MCHARHRLVFASAVVVFKNFFPPYLAPFCWCVPNCLPIVIREGRVLFSELLPAELSNLQSSDYLEIYA